MSTTSTSKKKSQTPRKPRKQLPWNYYHNYLKASEEYFGITYSFEYHFWDERPRFAFDAAIVCCMVAIEIEGWGHSRRSNYIRDTLKYNEATILGWRLLRFTPKEIKNLTYITRLERFFKNNPCIGHERQNQLLKELREHGKTILETSTGSDGVS